MGTPPSTPFSQLMEGTGSRLQATRLALGYRSQTAFAETLGVTSQRLNQWEHDKHPPDLLVMCALKVRHGVSLDWIYLGDWTGLKSGIVQAIVSLGAAEDAPPAARQLRHSYGLPHPPTASQTLHETADHYSPFSAGFREHQAPAPSARRTASRRRSKPA
jgi:transcriptional regulator with XRE-family HTH domain